MVRMSMFMVLLTLGCMGAGGSEMQTKCEEGNKKACANYAMEILDAGGDKDEAFDLLDDACTSDSAIACTNLAVELEEGTRLDKNLEKARDYAGTACAMHDSAMGCSMVGKFQLDGIGGKADLENAEKNLTKGCALGEGAACANLGSALVQDTLGAPDLTAGLGVFLKGCDKGHGGSCAVAAGMLEKGQGADADAVKAKELYKKACDLGVQQACG